MNKVSFEGESVYPSKIVCVGRNYVEHIRELDNPIPRQMVIFNKPNSALADELRVPGLHCHFETELSFLVFDGELRGIGVGLDLTRRDVQDDLKRQGLPWERAKAFDGSALFSDFVKVDAPLEDYMFELYINGKRAQQGDVSLMINKPARIVEEIRGFMSLCDGDVVMSGTPKGVGEVRAGDVFVVSLFKGGVKLLEREWVAALRNDMC